MKKIVLVNTSVVPAGPVSSAPGCMIRLEKDRRLAYFEELGKSDIPQGKA